MLTFVLMASGVLVVYSYDSDAVPPMPIGRLKYGILLSTSRTSSFLTYYVNFSFSADA